MIRPPHLLVIDPSVAYPEEEGVAEVLRGWPGSSEIFRPALAPGAAPRPGAPTEADGVVLMGSRASVHGDRALVRDLADWLAPLLDGSAPRPLLGICFGHQLVAHVAGGKVGPARPDGDVVCGVVTTESSGGRLLPGRQSLVVVASHREAVQTPPPGYSVTASRPWSPADALEHGEWPVFTVQFHPEAGEEFLRRRGVDPRSAPPRFDEDGRRILQAFRQFVLSWRARMSE